MGTCYVILKTYSPRRIFYKNMKDGAQVIPEYLLAAIQQKNGVFISKADTVRNINAEMKAALRCFPMEQRLFKSACQYRLWRHETQIKTVEKIPITNLD